MNFEGRVVTWFGVNGVWIEMINKEMGDWKGEAKGVLRMQSSMDFPHERPN